MVRLAGQEPFQRRRDLGAGPQKGLRPFVHHMGRVGYRGALLGLDRWAKAVGRRNQLVAAVHPAPEGQRMVAEEPTARREPDCGGQNAARGSGEGRGGAG